MSIVETVLVFAGIPIAVIALVTLAVYGRALMHQPNRYRPGRGWDYEPSWFVPHPQALPHGGTAHAALEGATTTVTPVGGASGEW